MALIVEPEGEAQSPDGLVRVAEESHCPIDAKPANVLADGAPEPLPKRPCEVDRVPVVLCSQFRESGRIPKPRSDVLFDPVEPVGRSIRRLYADAVFRAPEHLEHHLFGVETDRVVRS